MKQAIYNKDQIEKRPWTFFCNLSGPAYDFNNKGEINSTREAGGSWQNVGTTVPGLTLTAPLLRNQSICFWEARLRGHDHLLLFSMLGVSS
jgi:hypothetical protein